DAAIKETKATIERTPLPTLPGFSSQMLQLVQNLLSNAIKYCEQPPVIRIAARRVGDDWEVSVADNGIGIDAEYHEKIFGMCVRLHPRERYPGTGVGLAVCRRVVTRHRGRIWVESTPGAGSTFKFQLPAA